MCTEETQRLIREETQKLLAAEEARRWERRKMAARKIGLWGLSFAGGVLAAILTKLVLRWLGMSGD